MTDSRKKKSKPSSTRVVKRTSLLARRAFFIVNCILLVPAVLALFSRFIAPSQSSLFTYLSMAVPLLLCTIVFWIVVWVIIEVRLALPNLVILLLHLPNITGWVGLSGSAASDETIRVVSFNASSFYNSGAGFAKALPALDSLAPDILVLQEFYKQNNRPKEDWLAPLQTALGLPNIAFLPIAGPNYGLCILSRYPIKESGPVWPVQVTGTPLNNGIQYADIQLYSRTLRLYNVHLESYSSYRTSAPEDMPFDKPTSSKAVKGMLQVMPAAWAKQELQLQALETHRAGWNGPILIAGDLNQPPFGWVARQVGKGLQDTFLERGLGFGTTYNHPYLKYRIDYVFASPHFEVLDHRVPAVDISDHRPVVADLRFSSATDPDKVY